MTIKIFKNYGCLSAEKRVVYTYGAEEATAVCSDILTVKIPEDWECGENYMGELILTAPWGWTYSVDDVLQGDASPCFYALDKNGRAYQKGLEIIG